MFYLIGLGLNEKGYSQEAYEAVSKSEKIYIENYTVNFPYGLRFLEEKFGKKLIPADREFVEQKIDELLEEARKKNVALLVYGSPLAATTHIVIIQEAKKKKIPTKIIHGASVFDAVAETGLQLYKFGKTASMPNFEASSYVNIIEENQGIGSHSLILVDIGFKFEDALKKLMKDIKGKIKSEKIVVCSCLGTSDSKIIYETPEKLTGKKVKEPFCVIIPGNLHFLEKEFLESI